MTTTLNRRGFFGALAAAIAGSTLDPEKLLWVPGRKLISIPKPIPAPILAHPTALDIVNQALQLNGMPPTTCVSKHEVDHAFATLNGMLDGWNREGSLVLHMSPRYLTGIAYNLAVQLAPAYGVLPDAMVFQAAADSKAQLWRRRLVLSK